MPIKYSLHPLRFASGEETLYARPLVKEALSFNEIVQMAQQRGTTLTETDLHAAGQLLFETVCQALAEGHNVNLPLARFRVAIGGVFQSATDQFDPSRHSVKASISQGTLMQACMAKANLQKKVKPLPQPLLLGFVDVHSGSSDAILTPGGIGQLTGKELKFDKGNAAEGIFLVDSAGMTTQVNMIAICTDKKLLFSIPQGLGAGLYSIEVRKGYGTQSAIRTGKLEKLVEVA